MLYLALKVQQDLVPADIDDIIDCLIEEEKAVRQAEWATLPEHDTRWLLGLTDSNQRENFWFGVGEQLLALSDRIDDRSVRQRVIDIADGLTI